MTKPLWSIAGDKALADLLGDFRETARDATYGPYGYAGEDRRSRMNLRTYQACVIAGYLSGWGHVYFSQGGLNASAVPTSAKTHDGLDVADISVRVGGTGAVRPIAEQLELARWLDECGVCGMIRGTTADSINDGMVPHCHCVAYRAQHAHPQARDSVYSKTFGTAYGGAGLGGNTRARWYGPPLKHTDREWAASPWNPENGWRP